MQSDIILSVLGADGAIKATQKGAGGASLLYHAPYAPGDVLRVEGPAHLWLQLDHAVGGAQVYLPGGRFDYPVPDEAIRCIYPPGAFAGDRHLLCARALLPQEAQAFRNLAYNPYDSNGNDGLFPHVRANVETRGEAQFFARNAIDGILENHGHGPWPYTSWGIGERDDAVMTLYFGREVCLSVMALILRADFPHDNHWISARFTFADGSAHAAQLSPSPTDQTQHIPLPHPVRTAWVRLDGLTRNPADPSPFPALTQWLAFGDASGGGDLLP
ncbi:MAG: carbohydrate-binding protein [Oscillospiraceae bacterium]|jgi:hypothetical protein|nr:carbohydrate-binding protein [Oscillospiraceae bacterium]